MPFTKINDWMHQVSLSSCVPMILVCSIAADVVSRSFSIDGIAFTAADAALRNRPPYAAFERLKHVKGSHFFGDETVMMQSQFRVDRTEDFTTDAFGYRNSANVRLKNPSIILTGSSFGVGMGTNDNQTLSYKLTEKTGYVVYNACQIFLDQSKENVLPFLQPSADTTIRIAEKLGIRKGLVILELPERATLPMVTPEQENSIPNRFRCFIADQMDSFGLSDLEGRFSGFFKVSPLRRIIQRAHEKILAYLDIPSPYETFEVQRTLSNGVPILFNSNEISSLSAYRTDDSTLSFVKEFHNSLQARHLELLVVLLPSKFRVYRGALLRDECRFYSEFPSYLTRLESHLSAAGIEVVNLSDTLEWGAKKGLHDNSYMYFLNDTHWNSNGIDIAASELSPVVMRIHKTNVGR